MCASVVTSTVMVYMQVQNLATLVYRLEKIKKLTGLDLREFDDAIIFKVALMVKKYLVSRENRLI